MNKKIVELLKRISKETSYSYTTLSSVNCRVTNSFPNMSFDEKSKLLLSIIELNKFVYKLDNKKIHINGYQLDMVMYVVLSDILVKMYNEKNKKIEKILDEYLNEHKYYLLIAPELQREIIKELGVSEDTLRSCFYRLKRNNSNLNYKEIIEAMKFLLKLKQKFSFIPNRRVVKIKNNFYNSTKLAFLNAIINIKLNNKNADPDEIIEIYTISQPKVLIDEPKVKKEEKEKVHAKELENQIIENFGYSENFFRQLFRTLKCRNSSITDDSYISCLNMVIDLSTYVNYDKIKRHKVVIERFNYKCNALTFWLILFELKLKNPSMTLDDAVLKVVEQTGGNPYFSDDEKSLKEKGISVTKK